MSKIKKIKGFSDLFPPESTTYTYMEDLAREVFSRFGCQELRIPVLERTELFARSIGDETDIVQKEMYTFPDRRGRSLTMRPEATAGVIRALVTSGLLSQQPVVKLFTIGPMFRYERPQKGRQRQFHQINVEVLGSFAPLCDAEVILMLWTFLTELNLPGMKLELNTLGCPQCRPDFHASLQSFLQEVPAEKLCEDCRRRAKTNPLRVLDCKVPGCKEITGRAPVLSDFVCNECKEHFQTVQDVLRQSGVLYTLNPNLVRGLDYYQRTTFEVVSGDIGAQSSVAGGGRYDGLVKELGGPDIPAIGFACGMERLKLLMEDVPSPAFDFYFAVLDEQGLTKALLATQKLRSQGYRGEVGYEAKSIKSQLRQANKSGARQCFMLGPEELAAGKVAVKDMETGQQTQIPFDDLLTVFQ